MISNEEELISFLKSNIIFDLEKNEDKFGRYDCYSNVYDCYFELKSRRTEYSELILQKDKYEVLLSKNKSRYICSTPSGVYSLNVKKLKNVKWIEMLLPATTDFWNSNRIWKTVTLVPINYFKKLL